MQIAPNRLQSVSGNAKRQASRSLGVALREQSEPLFVDEALGWPEAAAPASGAEQPANDSNANVAIHRMAFPSGKAASSDLFLRATIGIL
ncbi:hypothetical protein GGR61_004300 [Xanthomonas arboricola]|nr:hypothetical protein [Xanthomonas sp. 3058]